MAVDGDRISAAVRSLVSAQPQVSRLTADVWRVRVAGTSFTARWSPSGWSPQVREAVRREPHADVLVANHLSPGARELLREAGTGWIEAGTGAARLSLDGLIVHTDGIPAPPRPARALWTSAALSIAEALLTGTPATIQAVHEATGASVGTASRVLGAWAARGLLSAEAARGRNSGRTLTDRRTFLDAYAQATSEAPSRASLTVGVLWRDPLAEMRRLAPRLDEAGISWAATGALAAAVMAPFLTTVAPVRVFIDASSVADLAVAARTLGAEPATGGRLHLEAFPTPLTANLVQSIAGVRCAPWPRVFADLRSSGVRGEDAAEHLLEVLNSRAGEPR